MAVEGGGGGDHDDDAAFGVGAGGCVGGHVGEGLADEVEGAAEVDVEDEVDGGDGEGFVFLVDDLYNESNDPALAFIF